MAGKRQPDFDDKYHRGMRLVDGGATWSVASETVGWNRNKLRHEYRMRTEPKYRERIRAHNNNGNGKRMGKLKSIIKEAKSRPCVDCDRIYPWEIMDLDHVRGVKVRNVGNGTGFSEETLREEIAKCEVRCPTCHRLRHQTERWLKK